MDDDTLSQCDEPADNLRARGSYKVKGRLPRSTKYYWKNKYDRSIPGKYLLPGTCKILLPLNFLKLSGSWAKVLFVRLWNVNWLKMLTVCKFLPFQILVKICECQLQFLWTHFKFSTQQILPLILQLNTLYCVVICLCLLLLNLFAAIHHLLRFPLSQLQFRKLACVTMSWLLLHHSTVSHGLTIIVH